MLSNQNVLIIQKMKIWIKLIKQKKLIQIKCQQKFQTKVTNYSYIPIK
jgi:hypothetical protein